MKGITVSFSDAVRMELGLEAVKEYPSECCGILLGVVDDQGNTKVTKVIPMKNNLMKDSDRKHYIIDPIKLYETERDYKETDREVIGFYHSHPDALAIPSVEDEEGMIPEMIYLITEVRNGKDTGLRGYIRGLDRDSLQELEITT